MRLRTKLFQLTLGAVIPPLVLAIVLGTLLVQYEREVFRRGAFDRNRAFMTAVDAEVRGQMTSLDALATSNNLESRELAAFYEESLRVLQSQSAWHNISLTLPSGQQVLNTLRPYGTALPASPVDRESVERVLRTRLPAVGSIRPGSLDGKHGIPVRVPVVKEGSVTYILSAVIDPEVFGRLIEAQNLLPSWTSGLMDSDGLFIATIPYRAPSERAADIYTSAVKQSPEGWFRAIDSSGLDIFTAHRTSDLSRWSVALAIPADEVNAAAHRAAWLVGLGGLLTIALAVLFAYLIGRRIAAPIDALAAAARTMGLDKKPARLPIDGGIREVREVAQALQDSSVAIGERQELIEREQSILRAADRAKDEFLAMLGHELRNPLSAVSNAATLLRRTDLTPEKQAAVQAIIIRQTEQLTRLVNDLLDVGRVVAGKIHLENQPCDLREITQAAVLAISATGRADAHRLSIHAAAPVFVEGDRMRLEQVVTNLVANAITHTPEAGTIDVFVTSETGSALLRVVDSGIGLREEDRNVIFDLFYQVDKGLHRKGGLGIGLTLVKRLVEMHGGSVSAMSAGPGRGATFSVRLPLVVPPVNVGDPVQMAQASAALDILVIDDSEDVRVSMRMLLESEGHAVRVASDGASGLQAALSAKPHVALVDIGMPGMTGYDVAREIRRHLDGEISLVAMTGYGQAADVRRAIEAGFDAHVVKPADLPSLNALLARLAKRAAAARSPPLGG